MKTYFEKYKNLRKIPALVGVTAVGLAGTVAPRSAEAGTTPSKTGITTNSHPKKSKAWQVGPETTKTPDGTVRQELDYDRRKHTLHYAARVTSENSITTTLTPDITLSYKFDGEWLPIELPDPPEVLPSAESSSGFGNAAEVVGSLHLTPDDRKTIKRFENDLGIPVKVTGSIIGMKDSGVSHRFHN